MTGQDALFPEDPGLDPDGHPRRIGQEDDAIERAARGASDEWKRRALGAVRHVAENHETFTSVEVWAALHQHYPELHTRQDGSDERRALGAVMRRAQTLGYCEATDRMVKAKVTPVPGEAGRNATRIQVWRSLLFPAWSR